MGQIIGIDLGTTNSVAAFWSRRRPKPIFNERFQSPLTPSVVAFENNKRFVGQDAKDRRASGSKNVIYSIKRFIGRDFDDPKTQKALRLISYEVRKSQNGECEVNLGGKYYSPVEISAMILQQIKADAETELGEEVTHAVITVPAYFSQRQKNATREAGKLAGLHVLRVISEPTAAALSFGIDNAQSEPQFIMVYDFGGGTFDISILMVASGSFEVLAVDGNNFLGGDDFDNLILERIFENLRSAYGEDFSKDDGVKSLLKAQAEKAKIQLSRDESCRIVEPGITKTRLGAPVNLDVSLLREDFETLITPSINESIELIRQALRHAGLEAKEINRVLLVGGSTRIPLARKKLKEIFGDRIEIDVDPMQCVALGAAIQTAIPIDWMCPKCNTVNEGKEIACHSCGQLSENEGSTQATVQCGNCKKNNRQGSANCWNCETPLGVVFEMEDETNQNYDLRIGDITSKPIGVAIEGKSRDEKDNELKVIIPKGTPYPTNEAARYELYTTSADQTLIRLPIFEIEEENAPKDQWELIGEALNERIPHGLPVNTPAIIELRIDGDGILTICSYLKKMKEETFVQQSFPVGHSLKEDAKKEELDILGFYGIALKVIGESNGYKKFLLPGQADESLRLEKKVTETINSKDTKRISQMIEECKEFRKKLPVPTWDVFWAYWVMEDPQISIVERKKAQETIQKMEQEASKENFPVANEYLNQLRDQTEQMWAKIPSNLLKARQG